MAECITGSATESFLWIEVMRHRIRDRNCAFGIRAIGSRAYPIAASSPRQDRHIETLIGSIRREYDLAVSRETHPRRVVKNRHPYSVSHSGVAFDCQA